MLTEKNCLVIGYGSIGQRHETILNELGHRVSVVSRRTINYPLSYASIEEAIRCEKPEYIIVANETSEHEKTLAKLIQLGYKDKILVEKPLYANVSDIEESPVSTFVGYNLRFHPIVQRLAEELSQKQVISVQSYVGQYLPTWRPGTDYRDSYSASKARGGGVLRDLSHELDYLQMLFGEWKEMSANGGNFSNLELDSDDHFTLIYRTEDVPTITVHMNYLDHITQRFIVINTNSTTYRADFISNTLQVNDEVFQFIVGRDDTYKNQHLAVLNDELGSLCTFNEGYNLLKMIKGAELASKEKVWVSNE